MRNLGLAFLVIIALFMGGCSIWFIGGTLDTCWITRHPESCGYGMVFSWLIAVPVLTFAVLLALFVWRKIKGLKINYRWMFLPIGIFVFVFGIFFMLIVNA